MRNIPYTFLFVFVFCLFFFIPVFSSIPTAHAMTDAEIQTQIQAKQAQKAALDAENAKLQVEIQAASSQAQSLSSTIKTLDTTQKKLQNDLKVTSNKLDTTKLTIEELGNSIVKTQSSIDSNKQAISESLRSLSQIDDASLIQSLLQYKNIDELWSATESLHQFQTLVKQKTDDLASLETQLQNQKSQNESKSKDLASLQTELSARKTIVEQNKTAKSNLLAVTKDQESAFEKMLVANQAKGKQFEQDLFQYESQLSIHLDQTKIPTAQGGILSWPLDTIVITQKFGKTVDSKRLYVSGTHNGVDFRATVGTPIKSVANGVVVGMDNTDNQAGCYSYGRWLLIQHDNGLSSLYAHLSAYNVTMGQRVSVGDVVGYTGGQPGMSGAGYSLGPHLHLGLFATQGVKIQRYTSSKFCKNVSIPIVEGLNVYLDPLAYLPPLN